METTLQITDYLKAALAEDIGSGDATGNAVIPASQNAAMQFRARETLVVAGIYYLPEIFHLVDATLKVELRAADGQLVDAGTVLATVSGSARAILAAERTALNLLQHLSAIATNTRRYVDAVAGTNVQIWDTRKTLPFMRQMQKYAVKCGGGVNHRMGLYDAVMIKDNHIAVAGSVAKAIEAAQANAATGIKIQVECDTLAQLEETLTIAGVDSVLLDNMDLPTLTKAVAMAQAKGVWSEASGNVNLNTVRAIAETGVNAISVGKLTHSVIAVDIGLDALD